MGNFLVFFVPKSILKFIDFILSFFLLWFGEKGTVKWLFYLFFLWFFTFWLNFPFFCFLFLSAFKFLFFLHMLSGLSLFSDYVFEVEARLLVMFLFLSLLFKVIFLF